MSFRILIKNHIQNKQFFKWMEKKKHTPGYFYRQPHVYYLRNNRAFAEANIECIEDYIMNM